LATKENIPYKINSFSQPREDKNKMHLLRQLTGRLLQSGTIIRPDSPDWYYLQYTETMLISERTAEKVTQLKIIFRREKLPS